MTSLYLHLAAKQWRMTCGFLMFELEFEWRFYALSPSKAIFRPRTYSHITYSVRDDDSGEMILGGHRPPGRIPILHTLLHIRNPRISNLCGFVIIDIILVALRLYTVALVCAMYIMQRTSSTKYNYIFKH